MPTTCSTTIRTALLVVSGIANVAAFTPDSAAKIAFATFGNEQTKTLIKAWQPQPLSVPNGEVLTPAATETFKRFVRARILLEDPSTGCVASFGENLCVILTKFNQAEHKLLLPLWQPSMQADSVFKDLIGWHGERFDLGQTSPRLSGSHLEADRQAWSTASGDMDA